MFGAVRAVGTQKKRKLLFHYYKNVILELMQNEFSKISFKHFKNYQAKTMLVETGCKLQCSVLCCHGDEEC